MKTHLAMLLAVMLGTAACAYGAQSAVLVAGEVSHAPAPLALMDAEAPPDALPLANGGGTIDLRGADLTGVDMPQGLDTVDAVLENVVFDTDTRWPAVLPDEIAPSLLLMIGMDPGLGVRSLHAQGYTGQGIGIAIIDQPLLVDHVEYADRVRLYRAYGAAKDGVATEHGTAAASIALGAATGVAPDALLYYIADDPLLAAGDTVIRDFSRYAQHIDRLIELNRTLPADERIRVIAMAIGWQAEEQGVDALEAAIERARAAGIAVLWRGETDPLVGLFGGMGRDVYGDPNDIAAARPALATRGALYAGQFSVDILVPMDGRTVASPTGAAAYTYYARGGEGWSVPYVAGLYALACQAVPDLTFEAFAAAALDTARSVFVLRGDLAYPYGQVADPFALLSALQPDSETQPPHAPLYSAWLGGYLEAE